MLAFSNDYYGMIFRATQSVELFCAYSVNVDQCEEIKIKQKADAIRERRFRGYGSSLIFILEMCYVLFSYARLIIDVENEINVRTMIYLNYFKRSGETLFIYFSREVWSINAGTTPCLEIQKPAANVAILIAVHKS